MYRFLLSPRWLVFHVVCLLGVVVMVNLGLWQLRRLDERQSLNARVEARSMEPPAEIGAVLVAGVDKPSVEWRQAAVRGSYDDTATVLIRDRPLEGRPGWHVVTPVRQADGTGVLVNRGWLPAGTDRRRPEVVPAAPAGSVVVVGRLRPSQERPALAGAEPAGVLTEAGVIDLDRLGEQSRYPLAPMYLELVAQDPTVAAIDPRPLPMPPLGEGPHRSYAVQWFVFATCVPIGWVLVVRKSLRDRRRAARRAELAETGEPEPLAVTG
ncbi:MAG: SURF1 family protein [Acidimicrobiales bacterium]